VASFGDELAGLAIHVSKTKADRGAGPDGSTAALAEAGFGGELSALAAQVSKTRLAQVAPSDGLNSATCHLDPLVRAAAYTTTDPPTATSPDVPTIEEQLKRARPEYPETCPSPKEFKSIHSISADIRPRTDNLPPECQWEDSAGGLPLRQWRPICYSWTAAATYHKPLYFEETQLERYGHTAGYSQSVLSAVHFFVAVPMLPYAMGVNPPNECQYTLGDYRPGDRAPSSLDPFPLSVRGALFECGAVTALPFLL
jgi:hypothetical protein